MYTIVLTGWYSFSHNEKYRYLINEGTAIEFVNTEYGPEPKTFIERRDYYPRDKTLDELIALLEEDKELYTRFMKVMIKELLKQRSPKAVDVTKLKISKKKLADDLFNKKGVPNVDT
jgi:hypothetical protein